MIVISSTALNFLQKDCIFRHVSGIKPSKPSKPSLGGAFFQVFFFCRWDRWLMTSRIDPSGLTSRARHPGQLGQLASKYRVMWDFIMDGICIYTIFIGFSKLWSLCFSSISHIYINTIYIYISIYLHVGMQLYNMLIQGPYMNPPHLQSEDSVPETVHHVVLYIDPCPFVAEAKKVWSPTFEDHPIQIYIYSTIL
jgi:hypothetical protein